MEIELILLHKAESEPVHLETGKVFQQHVIIFYVHLLLHFLPAGRGAWLEDRLPPSPSTPVCLEVTWKDVGSSCWDSKLQFFFFKFLLLKKETKSRLSCVISYHISYLHTQKDSPMLSAVWGQMCSELCRASLAPFFTELLMLTLNLWSASISACGTAV